MWPSTACLLRFLSTKKRRARIPVLTVGTVTEIFDYLRLMFRTKRGNPSLPAVRQGDRPADRARNRRSGDAASQRDEHHDTRSRGEGQKGEHRQILEFLPSDGFTRARIDGEVRELDEAIDLDKNKRHTIEVVTDRLTIADEDRQRLADCLRPLSCSVTASLSSTSPAPKSFFSVSTSRVPSAASALEIEPRMFLVQ